MSMKKRGAGILLHITSLPSKYGIGDLGPAAYQFADFLHASNQTYWQVLPVNPTSSLSGNSPYASSSAFAGSPLLLSPEKLVEDNLLEQKDLEELSGLDPQRVDYESVISQNNQMLRKAYHRFQFSDQHEYERFCRDHAYWLDDYARFVTFKSHFDEQAWADWPEEIRDRHQDDVENLEEELRDHINYQKFVQFLFFRQWMELKTYCHDRGIQLIGDIPYYVQFDSADVWTHPDLFKLNEDKRPEFVAGVPPDYFSETGQLWGNPVFDWEAMQSNRYAWWVKRVRHNFKLTDLIRIDHFRGFLAYWEVPASHTTAENGTWVEAPSRDFFNVLLSYYPNLPIIAEDLGVITPDVRELIADLELPGMKVLQFGFDEHLPENPYAPHMHVRNCVLYTGTHDNNTMRGWYEEEADDTTRQRISDYLGKQILADEIHRDFVKMAMRSVANTAIIPMQDLLGLNGDCRMNRPATGEGNWEWRLLPEQMNEGVQDDLLHLTELYGRD